MKSRKPSIKIVQCWDDGVIDDIRLCEILREAGATATFNLNPGLHQGTRSGGWRYKDIKEVYRLSAGELVSTYQGFTIANHSLSHPWPTQIPLEQWKTEVNDGRKQLQDIFGQEVAGFVYPYGDHNAATAEVVREAGHCYARTTANATPSFPPKDPMFFAADCHHELPDFWARYADAKAKGATVFYFWGHSYEFITEKDWQEIAKKYALFNADPDAEWGHLSDLFERHG